MFRLSTTLALLSSANAFDMDETSLMQGLKPAQELTQRHDKKKAITNLLSTATSMLKNGATPDVVNFATATLQEITGIVVPAVQDASNTDQDLIVQMFSYFEAALVELEQGTSETKTLYDEERLHSSNHKACRGREETACGHKQNCDYELYELWTTFSEQESIMRQLSTGVSSHFCAPDANGTLQIFREHSVSIFPPWIEQKPIVEHWEHLYDLKVPQCEEYFVDLDEETAQCDAYQTELEDSACQHAVKQHEVRSQFNVAWETATENYAQTVADVLALEADRWNEYKTLKTVECLLQATTAYNGRPCDETTVNSVQTDCESSRPQCTRIEHGDMMVGHPDIAQRLAQWRVHGFATIESPDETCDMCKVNQDGDIDASIVRDNSDTLASYQGLCIWYPTPPQQPDPCYAPYGLHDGRCDPNPPNAPCSALFHAQEYQELWMPPMPEFNSDNSHCNPRKECQACLGLPAPSPAPAWVNPILIAGPAPAPAPVPVPVPVQEGGSEYIGCFVDDSERDMGDMLGSSYTFATCRVACGAHTFMSLQYGGECFCANEYGTVQLMCRSNTRIATWTASHVHQTPTIAAELGTRPSTKFTVPFSPQDGATSTRIGTAEELLLATMKHLTQSPLMWLAPRLAMMTGTQLPPSGTTAETFAGATSLVRAEVQQLCLHILTSSCRRCTIWLAPTRNARTNMRSACSAALKAAAVTSPLQVATLNAETRSVAPISLSENTTEATCAWDALPWTVHKHMLDSTHMTWNAQFQSSRCLTIGILRV